MRETASARSGTTSPVWRRTRRRTISLFYRTTFSVRGGTCFPAMIGAVDRALFGAIRNGAGQSTAVSTSTRTPDPTDRRVHNKELI